jgi:hypothetical protein
VHWLGAFAIRAQSVGDDFHRSGPRQSGRILPLVLGAGRKLI